MFLDSPSLVIYPEIKATEVTLLALKPLPLQLLLQDKETKLVESKEAHCIYTLVNSLSYVRDVHIW